jgi:hypothetical protein
MSEISVEGRVKPSLIAMPLASTRHQALQHRIAAAMQVCAKAHAQLPQRPLNELLLGEEALTALSGLFPFVLGRLLSQRNDQITLRVAPLVLQECIGMCGVRQRKVLTWSHTT